LKLGVELVLDELVPPSFEVSWTPLVDFLICGSWITEMFWVVTST
jgi:hypothetical protein